MAETILNLDRFISKLDRLQKQEYIDTLEKACFLVENKAKIKAPVDTGQLRASITHEIDGETGIVGTNVEYAPYVEFGTGVWAVEGNGRDTPWSYQRADGEWVTTNGNKPQPFLIPSLLENEKEIVKLFQDAIKKGVK